MIHDTVPHGLKTWLWIAGNVSTVMGAFAVLFPFAATLAAELVIGAILVVSGILELVRAFTMRRNGSLPGTRYSVWRPWWPGHPFGVDFAGDSDADNSLGLQARRK